MSEETEKIHARLVGLEIEVKNSREGYVVVNTRYNAALESLSELAKNATDAAKRAAESAAEAARLARAAAESAKKVRQSPGAIAVISKESR